MIIKEDVEELLEELNPSEWCEDTSKDLMFEIETGKSANIQVQEFVIEELAGMIATTDAHYKVASEIRTKEQATLKSPVSEHLFYKDLSNAKICVKIIAYVLCWPHDPLIAVCLVCLMMKILFSGIV